VVIPIITDGAGADAIGGWFGTGPDRGIAQVFTLAGVVGALITIQAFNSRYYLQLSVPMPELSRSCPFAGDGAVTQDRQ
jgi:DHA3 family multidrug efflux protein-like MFS transporter